MVSNSPALQSHTQLTPEIVHEPKTIWVCPTPWIVQLQCHSSDTYRYTNNCPQKPTVRGTWAAHGVKVWYLGLSMEHYRCHRVYFTQKREERYSDCVEFFHTIILSLTIIPHKMSSSRRMNWPMPHRTQYPKRHFLTL